ncbi:carboxylesterase family protein [Solirubrobacter ginsenosidimutans]|uniref:Carboxylic ester hydrolase n=1 Tax=Solirubrobacter ginsenosidimutans TaxID=490573 RepID=A0A9X3RXZ2_9ACTN|nr:carboxylesterase family protein [Solirubrobacter ginsenosidimutans]MDA0159075.1 carboxylesterase family protein [Solirubrobacter ginsenosidimutans]
MPGRSASVELAGGRVRGRDGAYLGIPYATAQRFGAPRRATWSGELEAFAPGPPAPQPKRPISAFAHGVTPPGAEDCLTLNVWTPPEPGPWPVLVWAIGGGWTIGWAGSSIYDGAALARAANVVVVNFTYRLGSLGWVGGNWGLLDHVAVLEWVRENIAAFGGDASRVTLGGQSAGAANVADLLVCPAAEGLFGRAILHSPPLPEAANDPERSARWAADLWERVARDAPADEVVAAHEALLREDAWRGTRGAAWPTLDAATLPVSPLDAPDARPEIPVLVGTTRDEATFLFRAVERDPPVPDEVVRKVTAELFTEPTRRWAFQRAAAGGEVHLFRLDHPSHDPRLGALHTIDVPLLFGTFRTSDVARHYVHDDARTREVSEAMQTAWGRFLHGDDPGLATVPGIVYTSTP